VFSDWVYDLETYPNWFEAQFIHTVTGEYHRFTCTPWRNDMPALGAHVARLRRESGSRLVGFNNIGFDYYVLHPVIESGGVGCDYYTCYRRSQEVFAAQRGPYGVNVKPWEVLIPQVDLFKIHHLDNRAKNTSLKQLQFAMRSESVEDLPYPPGTDLTPEQVEEGSAYCFHDVTETLKFYWHSKGLLDFRDALSAKYGREFTNHNDTKIGKDFFIMKLEERQPGICFEFEHARPHVYADDDIPF